VTGGRRGEGLSLWIREKKLAFLFLLSLPKEEEPYFNMFVRCHLSEREGIVQIKG
jgi:hypothetical protein